MLMSTTLFTQKNIDIVEESERQKCLEDYYSLIRKNIDDERTKGNKIIKNLPEEIQNLIWKQYFSNIVLPSFCWIEAECYECSDFYLRYLDGYSGPQPYIIPREYDDRYNYCYDCMIKNCDCYNYYDEPCTPYPNDLNPYKNLVLRQDGWRLYSICRSCQKD